MASIVPSGNELMSTSRAGDSTRSFIRSMRLVPPARKLALASPLTSFMAAAASSARV